jgi:hypothetical protein
VLDFNANPTPFIGAFAFNLANGEARRQATQERALCITLHFKNNASTTPLILGDLPRNGCALAWTCFDCQRRAAKRRTSALRSHDHVCR